MDSEPTEVTRLLIQVGEGHREAFDKLMPIVYEELRRIAVSRVSRESAENSLDPTDLVHEAFLRLVKDESPSWHQRAHFFNAAAEAMRRILIERARRRSRVRHGGAMRRDEPKDIEATALLEPEELFALDEALTQLEEKDERMAQVVKLRYFAGLTVPETAQALATSPRSVNRAWTVARAWLYKAMKPTESPRAT